MKLAKFTHAGRCAAGIVRGDMLEVIGLWHERPAHRAPFDAVRLSPSEWENHSDRHVEQLPLAAVQLAAPLDPSSKVICVGANYHDHAAEIGQAAQGAPQTFLRHADSLVGHGDALVRPLASQQFDFEGELAVVIGRAGRHIAAEAAMHHVLGYTCFMDGSVRDFQRHAVTAGKNFWRSGAMGPWIVSADEVPDLASASLRTELNGVTVQRTTIARMVHGIAALIAYCSQWTPLEPGDVIATGTPAGIGARRDPPLWMRPGDRIAVHVDGVGELANTVVDERAAPA